MASPPPINSPITQPGAPLATAWIAWFNQVSQALSTIGAVGNLATITGNYTAVSGDFIPVDTAGGPITVKLPLNPTAGMAIGFSDVGGVCATNNLTIDPQGTNIIEKQAAGATMIVRTNNVAFALQYVDSIYGWALR